MKQLFSTLAQALQSLQKGKMIILVDDQHRENEGDFVMAAQFATEKTINVMITQGKGLVCAPVSEEVAKRLDLPFMVTSNTESFRTAFTVSIDAKTNTTGISAKERADTLNLLANPKAKPNKISCKNSNLNTL
jgi:3,4-dihydroxy 2-butanone 4-phosphate synthase/GTP cyclohydrolase II